MSKLKIALIGVGILIIPIFFGLYEIGLFKLLMPMKKNVEREVFENTKSYLHAAQQDLGKYYREHQAGSPDEKRAIKAVINMRFAELDVSKLQSPQLRTFLRSMRGY